MNNQNGRMMEQGGNEIPPPPQYPGRPTPVYPPPPPYPDPPPYSTAQTGHQVGGKISSLDYPYSKNVVSPQWLQNQQQQRQNPPQVSPQHTPHYPLRNEQNQQYPNSLHSLKTKQEPSPNPNNKHHYAFQPPTERIQISQYSPQNQYQAQTRQHKDHHQQHLQDKTQRHEPINQWRHQNHQLHQEMNQNHQLHQEMNQNQHHQQETNGNHHHHHPQPDPHRQHQKPHSSSGILQRSEFIPPGLPSPLPLPFASPSSSHPMSPMSQEPMSPDSTASSSSKKERPRGRRGLRIKPEPFVTSFEPLVQRPTHSPSSTPLGPDPWLKIKKEPDLSKPPRERVIASDVILSRLMSLMDKHTVEKCRLVNARWTKFGAMELRKRTNITLHFSSHSVHDPENISEKLNILSFSHGRKFAKTTKEWEFASPTQPLFALTRTILNSDGFPCNSFTIITSQIQSPSLQNLLSDIGVHIRELTLDLRLLLLPSTARFNAHIFTHLRNLLLKQVTNLERFRLLFYPPDSWKYELNMWNGNNRYNLFEGIFSLMKNKTEKLKGECQSQDKNLLHKLRYLSIEGNFPYKACQQLLEASPALETFAIFPETNTMGFYHTAGNLLSYFIKGDNEDKIDLLKKLHFAPSIETLQAFERLFLYTQAMKLKSIHVVNLGFVNFREVCTSTSPEFWPRVGIIIKHLFEACSTTLLKLTMVPLRPFCDRIPILPRLKVLKLHQFVHMPIHTDTHFFPRGFNFQMTFPNLRCIEGDVYSSCGNQTFIAQMDIPEGVVMTGVQWIRLLHCRFGFCNIHVLSRIFPRARIHRY